MGELRDITSIVLESIKIKIPSETIFNLWFGKFDLVVLDEEKAVFSTPTNLRKRMIENKYLDIIERALEESIGFPLKVEIISLSAEQPSSTAVEEVRDHMTERDSEEVSREDSEERERVIKEYLDEDLSSSPSPKKSTILDYTFDNFIEGTSNKFAKAACFAVANDLTYYNPLFIHGHSGLGKTHLLYAVINYIKEKNPKLKIIYKKCEDFMNEMIEAISKAETSSFKERYRTADVLLIDDIQFIAGKESTQEEFFHTFSALYESDKQIILTSDRPPKEIRPLEDRLRTRFEGGLLADIQPPSFELRTAIIKKKASVMNLLISNELVDYMASRLQNNIRQIEGVLKRLYAIHSLSATPVTKESIDQAISFVDPGNIPTDALIEKILTVVSQNCSVPIESMKSKKKTASIANARHIAIYIIRNLTKLSLKEIGNIFNRDYTTVLSSIDKVEMNIRTVNKASAEIKKMIKEIKS